MFTLVQSGTGQGDVNPYHRYEIVRGQGTDITDNVSLQKRAKKKMITQKMVLHLIRVLESKGETDRAKPYWNAYYCQNNLVISNGNTYGKYCKARFCSVCLSIIKAKIMNDYIGCIH